MKMKITVFTSNQPRHLSLIKDLSVISDEVYAIQECNTVFPGEVKDFFGSSAVMKRYFKNVIKAEEEVFGNIGFLPDNVRQLALKDGDLNKVRMDVLEEALQSDIYVVFGSSFIKFPLIDFLIERKAINIHMGISPYYRGNSCNFWAAYDGHPELVGATIHMLGRGLDSGDILYHALPKPQEIDLFTLGMKAVKVAHNSVTERIASGEIFDLKGVPQDRTKEYRYTKNNEFTDEVAEKYMEYGMCNKEETLEKLANRDLDMFVKPYMN